jgi:hypothetical protein
MSQFDRTRKPNVLLKPYVDDANDFFLLVHPIPKTVPTFTQAVIKLGPLPARYLGPRSGSKWVDTKRGERIDATDCIVAVQPFERSEIILGRLVKDDPKSRAAT